MKPRDANATPPAVRPRESRRESSVRPTPGSHDRPGSRRAFAAAALLFIAGCAPVAALAPAGVTTAHPPGSAAAATDPHHLGDAIDARGDSLVVLIFGDNRPGYRMQASLGYHGLADFSPLAPGTWLLALVSLPVFAVQAVLPTLDSFQDAAALFTRRPNGGAEAQVLRALRRMLPVDLVINTGDLVFQGHRARLWRDFERKFGTPEGPPGRLRAQAPFLAAPGNHERLHTPEGRANWSAVLGAPPRPERFWFSIDAGGGLARFVFLDSNVLANVHGVYSEEEAEALSREQLEWLDRALDTDARHRFVVLHHPLMLVGNHYADWLAPAPAARRDRVLEICARRGVTAVLAGHEHLYHRVRAEGPEGAGFWLITTGGGGSPLHRIEREINASEYERALPAGLRFDRASARTEVRHHFFRLVIPAAADRAPRLDVYGVDSGARTEMIESLELSAPR
jgi:hypothetical protein